MMILAIFTFNTQAQKPAYYYNRQAFNRILCMQHDEARNFLDDAKTADPLNIHSYYLENYLEFLKCLSSGSKQQYSYYKENFRKRVQFIKINGQMSDSALLLQAEMQFHTFVLAAFSGERLNAFRYFFQFSEQVESLILSAEKLKKVNLLKGLCLIIMSSVPDEYQWALSYVGLQGDLDSGLKMVEKYQNYCKNKPDEFLESLMILTLARHVFERDFKKNYSILSAMPKVHLQNPLFRFAYVLTASRAAQNDEVINVLRNHPQQKSELRVCYFDYLLGEAMLNRLDRNADEPLKRFIGCGTNGAYIVPAYKKLAWIALINKDTVAYTRYRNKILQADNLTTEAGLQAKNEFQEQEIPNVNLIKARLLFDGGYYSSARNILLQKEVRESLKNVYQQTEYAYRLARIYHLTGEHDKAIKLYKLTCENGWEYPMYYAAYAALQLGYIFENSGDLENAAFYFNRALQSKNISYGQRIRYEAKNGLKRLK
ncbi:MAG: hypothetical protein R6W78_04945 [Bacteroidales bacterium]